MQRMPVSNPSATSSGRRHTELVLSSFLLFSYPLFLIGSALDAYNIAGVPIPWVTRAGLIIVTLILGLFHRLKLVPGTKPMALLLLWGVLVTLLNALRINYAEFLPPLATTPYLVYVLLRVFVVASFLATMYLVYWLLSQGYRATVIRWTVIVATVVALASIYIYVAQLHGFPEPFRTRLGTAGGEQAIRFTYPFHRAMGTFREPSHLAEWLVVPFFLSLVYRQQRFTNVQSVIIAAALLLTGSLTGIVSIPVGFLGSIVLARGVTNHALRISARFLLAGLLAAVVFSVVASGYDTGKPDLVRLIDDRLTPILFEGGLARSNRDYVYEYVRTAPIPALGVGFGNANLLLSHHLGTETVASFLSLYLYTTYSIGVVGLVLLAVFLLTPIFAILRRKRLERERWVRAYLAAYLAWLIMFAVNSEELHIMFSIVYCLLAFELFHGGPVGTVDSS